MRKILTILALVAVAYWSGALGAWTWWYYVHTHYGQLYCDSAEFHALAGEQQPGTVIYCYDPHAEK